MSAAAPRPLVSPERVNVEWLRVYPGSVKVVLPDSTELELPDGASGLDAARAIGPKLAEQAVLVKADGIPQDLRLPLADGASLQILTTRDTTGSGRSRGFAPLGRPPARRGGAQAVPGRQGGDRASDRQRLLLRLRLSGADQRRRPRGDRGRGAARARRGTLLGARGDLGATRRGPGSRPRASRTRSTSSTRPRGRSRSTRRAISPTSAAGRTFRPPRRSRRSS